MPLMPSKDSSPGSYRQDNQAIWRDIRALWKASKNVKTPLSNAEPKEVDTEPSAGSGEEAARWDHVHEGAPLSNVTQFHYDSMIVP